MREESNNVLYLCKNEVKWFIYKSKKKNVWKNTYKNISFYHVIRITIKVISITPHRINEILILNR